MASQNEQSLRNKLAWVFIFILVAAASVWAVASQSEDFTVVGFLGYIVNASPFYMAAAALSVIAYIFFEACSLKYLTEVFGYKRSFKQNILYSAADIYVSAITPSASGGQPAAAYFMFKDDIPVAVSGVILLLNITVYAVSILSITLFGLIVRPDIFMGFDGIYKFLILIGFCAQSALLLIFIVVIKFKKLVEAVCSLCIAFLCKLHIIKNRDKAERRIEKSLDEYRGCSEILSDKKRVLPYVFLFNFMQRASIISVMMFTYLATHGGDWSKAFDVWMTQAYVFLGANSIPIPGAVGVTDALILNGFKNITNQLAQFALLGRSLSFYCCVLLCGTIMFGGYFYVNHKRKKALQKKEKKPYKIGKY